MNILKWLFGKNKKTMARETAYSKNEPADTLSWYAYHEISPDFHNRWSQGKLTKEETVSLIERSINYVDWFKDNRPNKSRSMFAYDMDRLTKMRKLLYETQKA